LSVPERRPKLGAAATATREDDAMPELLPFAPGNYTCLAVPGGPFSAGVRADPGYALHRARFARPLPMVRGFAALAAHLTRLGRPLTALAGCELRSPAPMTRADFNAFNAEYLRTLHGWGVQAGTVNPAARSNIAPILEVPAETTLFAFTYTVPEPGAAGDFLISGKPEVRGGPEVADRIVGGRDTSLRGMERKARFVIEFLQAQVQALGCDWAGVTATQVYTPHDLRPLLEPVFAPVGLTVQGVTWFPAWPPVQELDFEADVRRVRTEIVL
jgi:hypothetical protein